MVVMETINVQQAIGVIWYSCTDTRLVAVKKILKKSSDIFIVGRNKIQFRHVIIITLYYYD